ncbi:homoserine dehydrogenase [Coralloluteibacterium thermophilus]|uniref:homoserine dehydrogenase n=1 Tax=Coralloluteibacterium thermophilum TaxID=2707049 RepID=A0ABV9NIB3_9GAMM
MSALRAAAVEAAPRRLAVLGTGVVGSAFVARYARLRAAGVALPALSWLANSRHCSRVDRADAAGEALAAACASGARGDGALHWLAHDDLGAGDVVVDATASDAVAARHGLWLRRGVDVVTANKLGQGAALARADEIRAAQAVAGARYGDGATVGAGLPLLSSLRALVAGGDRIHAVEGILSGSLAWLFNGYDGSRPFSERLRLAREQGYTEPDPRVDLSGEDVRRKLLILARAAGWALEADAVSVASLLPRALAQAAVARDGDWRELDAPLADRLAEARAAGGSLQVVGRLDHDGASVALRVLPAGHALAGGRGTDNRVAIWSDRYSAQPLVIQGPGAGAEVTAAALLDDVLALHRA